MRDQVSQASARSLVERMRRGETTVVAVMRSCLDRIAAFEPTVRASAHLDPAAAARLMRARADLTAGS